MATRSERRRYPHPYPAVIEAIANALPTHGFTVIETDPAHGRVTARHRWSRWSLGEVVTVHVGADDATATSVAVDSSLRLIGVASRAHPRNFARVFAALDSYLAYYYGRA